MKIRLISVGRTDEDFIRIGSERYLKQIRGYQPVEEVRIKGVKTRAGCNLEKALAREAEAILKAVDSRDRVILLDRQGRLMTSEAFASFLESELRLPARSLTFLIGSAEGVSKAIQERADERLSLSKMTFTHELSRLLLLEQIYRGFTILRGKRYHR